MAVRRYRAYIDETGDEGFVWREDGSGSSRWFIMGAVVVEDSWDLDVASAIDDIKDRLELKRDRPLHWVERRDHRQRKVMIQGIVHKPFCLMYVGVYKPDISSEKLKKTPGLYLYTTRYLLERVSWYVDDNGGRVDCIFEHRGNLSYEELQAYIRSLISNPENQIRPVIDKIEPRNKHQVKNLQVIDICLGAASDAFEPDRYGNYERSYLAALRSHLYRKGGNLFSYGLKLFPTAAGTLMRKPGWEWLGEI